MTDHRCGFVTLVGAPNVGKSTLLNRMLGEKIAITSSRPQTTRNRIPGVLTRPEVQLVFIDTPGLHKAKRALNQYMMDVAQASVWETDALAILAEAGLSGDGKVGIPAVITELLERLGEFNKPVILVLNKIDKLEKIQLLPVIDQWNQVYDFAEIVPVSAMKGDGVDHLVDTFCQYMPEGPALYPEDALTDLPERFIATEIIREKLFRALTAEVPYSIAVSIERWRDRARDGLVEIQAAIHVERDSQKGIVIGKGGAMLKQVGTYARQDLERLLGVKVHLSLFVKVDKAWTRSAGGLRKFGYDA